MKASKNGFKALRDPKLREVGAEHMKQQSRMVNLSKSHQLERPVSNNNIIAIDL